MDKIPGQDGVPTKYVAEVKRVKAYFKDANKPSFKFEKTIGTGARGFAVEMQVKEEPAPSPPRLRKAKSLSRIQKASSRSPPKLVPTMSRLRRLSLTEIPKVISPQPPPLSPSPPRSSRINDPQLLEKTRPLPPARIRDPSYTDAGPPPPSIPPPLQPQTDPEPPYIAPQTPSLLSLTPGTLPPVPPRSPLQPLQPPPSLRPLPSLQPFPPLRPRPSPRLRPSLLSAGPARNAPAPIGLPPARKKMERFVMKRAFERKDDQTIKREIEFLRRLRGAKNIQQLYTLPNETQPLELSYLPGPTLFTEWIPNGQLRDLVMTRHDWSHPLLNRMLWMCFLCMCHMLIAMAWPPEGDLDAPSTRPELPPADSSGERPQKSTIRHNDINIGNSKPLKFWVALLAFWPSPY